MVAAASASRLASQPVHAYPRLGWAIPPAEVISSRVDADTEGRPCREVPASAARVVVIRGNGQCPREPASGHYFRPWLS
jgi:hypothetical protein